MALEELHLIAVLESLDSETVGWLTFKAAAARVKLPWLATPWKARRCR
jgi:hypothetical protein